MKNGNYVIKHNNEIPIYVLNPNFKVFSTHEKIISLAGNTSYEVFTITFNGCSLFRHIVIIGLKIIFFAYITLVH